MTDHRTAGVGIKALKALDHRALVCVDMATVSVKVDALFKAFD